MGLKQAIEPWREAGRAFARQLRVARAQQRFGLVQRPDPDAMPTVVARDARCAFVLSTGRAGTKLLTQILERCPGVDVHHNPQPELVYPGRLAYAAAVDDATFRFATWVARYEYVRRAYVRGLLYVETNNRITFFAPWLAPQFAQSRFLHLVRDPYDFTRSGLRRGYYQGNALDEGRIRPRAGDPIATEFAGLPPLGKIAWLWNATNAAVEEFKQGMPPDRVMTARAEDFFANVDVAASLLEFLGAPPLSRRQLSRLIAVPVNAQNMGPAVAAPAQWSPADRALVARLTPLAARYGYGDGG